jgi:uncharacterized protein
MLPDGRRLHLHDGPIDLIVQAFGPSEEIHAACHAASARFVSVLDELCGELKYLRSECCPEAEWPHGVVARRMVSAVMPYASEYFITPMAAVAGAVAEEILSVMTDAATLSRAYVNNGGDIAIHLDRGHSFTVGMVERPDRPSLFGMLMVESSRPVRGVATSGWRGRSLSFGIADAVTVLADRAAAADAAATIVANAVDLPEHTAIHRVPARDLAPDSDLGSRLVTQAVGYLTASEVDRALASGIQTAERLLRMGLIRAAALNLCGETRLVGIDESERSLPAADERSLVHA